MSKKKSLSSMNCGYAHLTQSGETLQMTTRAERFQQFQFQLYHYAALGIKFQESLSGRRVLDLCCGRGGGGKLANAIINYYCIVQFLAEHYEAKEAVGIDISSHQIATA